MREYQKLESTYKSHALASIKQYQKMKYDIVLLRNYFIFTVAKLDSIDRFDAMKDYARLYPSSNGLCELGRWYKELDNFEQSKECFIFASNINPSLITPNYELFLLYQENEKIEDMEKIGRNILNRSVKKEGTASIKMKTYIKNALRESPK